MDAGVPIKAPVAGVAMGLITGDGRYTVLTDIEGMEDALGDMDFKVAGTSQGITALQMDVKLKGIPHQVISPALEQAREARLFVLERMKETINQSRPELSKYAPRMIKIKINPDKIRFVIGPGGKTIRSIQDEFKVTVEVENDGTVIIGSVNEEAAQRAIKMIEDLTREVEVGGIFTGKVTRITNLGAFVEVVPGTEGLVPLGELADYQAPSVEDVVKVGDEIMVMVTEIDRLGRVNLSRKAVFDKLSGIPGARVGTGQPRPSGPPFPGRAGPPPQGQARGPRRPEGKPPEGDQGGRYPRDRRRPSSEGPPRRPPFK
jgi:polyribonucleotide nucleotidyltransferase